MFQQMSIGKKLALALWGAAFIAFLVASVVLLLFENLALERRAQQALEPYVQLVSVSAEAAVAFNDPERANEILHTLRVNPQILEADLLLENGMLLAKYLTTSNTPARPLLLRPDGIYLEPDVVELMRTLPEGAHLRIIMSLQQLRQMPQMTLWIFSIGVLVLLVITLGLVVALRQTIVRPISTLAEAAEQVRTQGDYSRRVPASGADEVARLGRSFNSMMEAIAQRGDDLRRINLFHRTILDHAAYGIISTTPDGLVTSFNLAAERLLGFEAQEVVGKQTPALWHDPEEIAQRARELSRELGVTIAPGFDVFAALPREGLPDQREWTFIRKNGTRVPAFLSIAALRSERGEITGYAGLAYDVTERRQAEEALRKLNEELERRVKERTADLQARGDELKDNQRALMNIVEDLHEKTMALEATNERLEAVNSELEAFSYSVSHDLRAPLRGVDGFSQALLEDYSDKLTDEGKHYLHRIRSGAQRMGQLIDDMLKLSRVTRGEMQMERVSLSTFALEILRDLARREPERRVTTTIAPEVVVVGDVRLLKIVLENLLGNAWKFTSKRPEATIEFGLSRQNDRLAYFVRDNGAGFDAAYSGRLFGAFQRLHTTEEFPGTGVGLATVQRIIHRHGGRIWAESQVGEGATFYFTLP